MPTLPGLVHALLVAHNRGPHETASEGQAWDDWRYYTAFPESVWRQELLAASATPPVSLAPDEVDRPMRSLGWDKGRKRDGDRVVVRGCHFCGGLVSSEEARYTATVKQQVVRPDFLGQNELFDEDRWRRVRLYCCARCAARGLPGLTPRHGMQVIRILKRRP